MPALCVTLMILFLMLSYFHLLPKPIPGKIPFNKLSRYRLQGDLPDLLRNVAVTRSPLEFFCDMVSDLQSPIVQIWVKPFSRPIVVLSDPYETEDIMIRRIKEFDRGHSMSDTLETPAPFHHVRLSTNDQFKAQRKFISDARTPTFLKEVGAAHIHESATNLVNIWRQKARLANGFSFDAQAVITHAIFDAIWAIAIGENADCTNIQYRHLTEHHSTMNFTNDEEIITFPTAPLPKIISAITSMVDAVETVLSSPIPILHHRILRLFPKLHHAYAIRDHALDRMVQESKERFAQSKDPKN